MIFDSHGFDGPSPLAGWGVVAMANTLLAMGPDGRTVIWERLCSAPTNLPNVYATHTEANAGRAFRLTGTRSQIVDWSAAAIYGSSSARGALVGGPLYPARVMVYHDGTSYLYTDAADDYPHDDPKRSRHFGMVDGDEWGPLDAALVPGKEFITIKANGGGRFYRQWGRAETIAYLRKMALDHLKTYGIPLGLGDISITAGGDITDHASHEVGLDADLYLLTFDGFPEGNWLYDTPQLWVSSCAQSAGWNCEYRENSTGLLEDLDDPNHLHASGLLTSLAQYAYDNPGPSWFVQHDVVVLQPFIALPGSDPQYVQRRRPARRGDLAGDRAGGPLRGEWSAVHQRR